jgi:cation diffusion facilitator CzcD-associated flavoprotein CzcO
MDGDSARVRRPTGAPQPLVRRCYWAASAHEPPLRVGSSVCAVSVAPHTNGRGPYRRRPVSIAVVGAGLGGVGAAVLLHRAGYDEVTVFERGERVGGVWNHNTYPGAACDVPSHLYEFSFDPNPRWSRRYAPQAEIQSYVEGVARRHGVLDRIRTGTEVTSARWDEDSGRWILQTSAGVHEAAVLLTACGQLSVAKMPSIPGLESFDGPVFHTSQWRHDVDLLGKRVAVVGTGCSAIQTVPAIQPLVGQLDVYQRSPGWTIPKMDFPYSERTQRLFERFPILQRLDRAAIFAFMELGALGMTRYPRLLGPFRALGRRQITKAIADEELRAKVTPRDEIGCKRLMLTDEWYPTLTKANVELITDPIAEVTAGGLRLEDGSERPADVVVLATGFETHGFVAPMEITGAGGRSLSEVWSPVPRAYLGLSVPSFPNMFLLYGPNTNGGTGSVIDTIEAGVSHVIAALSHLELARASRIEVRAQTAQAFDTQLRAALGTSVWHTGCTNWYVDENGNDPNQWPWLWSTYRRRASRIEPGAYELSTRAPERAPAS